MSDIIAKLQSEVWAERLHRHNEAVLESFGTDIDGSVIDGLLVGGVIGYTVPAVGVETCWRASVRKNTSWLKSKVLHHTYFCLCVGSFWSLIIKKNLCSSPENCIFNLLFTASLLVASR